MTAPKCECHIPGCLCRVHDVPVTARPVGDGDDLWERIATALEVAGPMTPTLEAQLRAALLPVVRDWAVGQLRAAALDWPPTWAVDPATYLEARADELAADDRTGQR